VYQMSLEGAVWKIWREPPGFWSRYTGGHHRRCHDDHRRLATFAGRTGNGIMTSAWAPQDPV